MPRGDVIHWSEYSFSNGGIPKNKYLLQINKPKEEQPFLFCICNSTSSTRYTHGCHEDRSIYFLEIGSCRFQQPTYINLKPEEIQPLEILKSKLQNRDINYQFTLAVDLMNSIIKCIKICEDISPYIISLLKN